jgi:hypothetical protein
VCISFTKKANGIIIIIIVTPLSLSETNGLQNARTTGRQREADTERNRNHTERNRNHKASHVPSVEKPGKTDRMQMPAWQGR